MEIFMFFFVGYWGRINGIPPLYYVSICQRNRENAPDVSKLQQGLPLLPSIQPPPERPAYPFWRRHSVLDIQEYRFLLEFLFVVKNKGIGY
jgi:hypothetical protein